MQAQRRKLGSLNGMEELRGLAEIIVMPLGNHLTVAVIGGAEHRRVTAHLLSQALNAVSAGVLGLLGHGALIAELHAAVRLLAAGDVPAAVAAASGDGVADGVLIAPLVHNALAPVVHDQAGLVIDADAAGQAGINHLHGRMLIVEGADLFRRHKPVAHVALRGVAEIVGYRVAGHHLLVSAVAAGGQDDALAGIQRQLRAVGPGADHAGDGSVLIGEQAFHGGVIDDLAMQVVLIVQGEGGGDLAALAVGLAAAAGRVMYAPGLQADVDGLHIQHIIMGL